jgi:hypothetical protein
MTDSPRRGRLGAAILGVVLAGCSGVPPASPSGVVPTATGGASALPSPSLPGATPTADPVPLVTPPPPSASPRTAAAWRSVPTQPAIVKDQFTDVAWTGDRFVAMGFDDVLDSVDGVTWHRQPAYRGWKVAAGPMGVVATGWVDDLASRTSVDGIAWTVRAKAFAVAGAASDEISVTAVTATAAGWLAVGRQDPGGCSVDCGTAPVRAIVWTSSNGLDWTRVADQESFRHAAMTGVVVGGPGYVAVGQAGAHAAVWASTDGAQWTRVPDASVFHAPDFVAAGLPAVMTDVTEADGTLIAVGNVYTQDIGGAALAWWSTDGTHWSRGTGGSLRDGQTWNVTWIPGGFLATGGGPDCNGLGWSSPDGRAWRCLTDPQIRGFNAYAVAVSPAITLAVGFGGPGEDETAGAIWIRDN